MQGKVASKMPRIVVVSRELDRGHPHRHGRELDRMRLVPVGVDPDLFKPLDHVTRRPGRLITTASADVALKGSRTSSRRWPSCAPNATSPSRSSASRVPARRWT
jgi:hypothetical protein